MHVPTAEADFDEADAVLDEATGEEAALAEVGVAVFGLEVGGFGVEVESGEVGAFHDFDGVFVDVGVGTDGALVVGFFEVGVEFGGEVEAVVEVAFGESGGTGAVLQAGAGVVEDEGLEGGLEEAAAGVFAIARDDDGAGEVGVAFALEFLEPGAHGGVAGGAAHGVAGVLEVVALFVSPLGAGHAIDDDAVVHVFGDGGEAITELDAVGTGGDAFGVAHGVGTGADAEGVEVGHAAGHVEINDVAGGGDLFGFGAAFEGGGGFAIEQRKDGDAEAGLGDAEDELAAGRIGGEEV